MIDFKTLVMLQDESGDMELADIIAYLEMNEVEMTPAVRKLGIAIDVLYA